MLAEAQYRSGATGDAATTLNKLISARTDGAKDASNYNGGGDLWEMIKLQYRIEMWGEGREFYNNKRWNIPINRNKDYHPNATTLTFPVSGMVCKIPEKRDQLQPAGCTESLISLINLTFLQGRTASFCPDFFFYPSQTAFAACFADISNVLLTLFAKLTPIASKHLNMKRDFASRLLFPLCGMLALTVTSCNKTAKDQPSRHRFIHNNDGSDALLNRWFGGHPAHKADIDRYVDMVAETSKGRTQVTTFMMCSGSDFIYYPSSKYGRYFGGRQERHDALCRQCDEKVWQLGGQSVRNLEAEGTDVIKASLERAKMHGMEAFITYRVNDLHFADSSSGNPATFPDFWIEHPEYWTGDSTQGWHSAQALDFSYPEVRQHKLNLIKEQLEKYDMIDGYELDFMRFIVLFKSGEGKEKAPLITDMVREVKRTIDSLSEVRGHKILLAVRVPVTVEGALEKGSRREAVGQRGTDRFYHHRRTLARRHGYSGGEIPQGFRIRRHSALRVDRRRRIPAA